MLKRSLDFLVAAVSLVLLSPLLAFIAVLVTLDSEGPAFHRPVRVGKDGKPFTMFKFRTMVVGAAQRGPGLTRQGDPRVTRLGRWLRRLKVDELPQLINVLFGEMSLVGPRPEDPRYVAHYTPEQREVLAVQPGIASPAAVKYRREEALLAGAGGDLETAYLTLVLPDKLSMDLDYVRGRSFWRDLSVLAQLAGSFFIAVDNQDARRVSTLRGLARPEGGADGITADENRLGLPAVHLPFEEGPR